MFQHTKLSLIRMNLAKRCTALLYLIVCVCEQSHSSRRSERDSLTVYQLLISLNESQHHTTSRFLGVAVGLNRIINNFSGFYLDSNYLKNAAAALAPCIVRIGGTRSDFMTFVVGRGPSTPLTVEKDMQFNIYSNQMLYLTDFIKFAGWDIVFSFNLFKRLGSNWDPANAKIFLDFAVEHNISIEGFHVGNEVNAYPGNGYMVIEPKTLVNDITILRDVLSTYPMYKRSKVLGPEVTRFNKRSAADYLKGFLKAGGCNVVSEVTFHQYYISGPTAKVEEFTNVSVLDCLAEAFDKGKQIMKEHSCYSSFRMTETSSAFGGGTDGMSDRYMAGFLWLDKLGQSALNGVTVVHRQTFYGGHYGLINFKSKQTTPDYYLSLLFKRLVEGPVFKVRSPAKQLRAYCNCAREGLYKPGAIVVYYLNLAKEPCKLNLAQFADHEKDVYSLTPEKGDLAARRVLLNGQLLNMIRDAVPPTPPLKVSGDVQVEGRSFGFIVVPDANQTLCKKYFIRYSVNSCSSFDMSPFLRIITLLMLFMAAGFLRIL